MLRGLEPMGARRDAIRRRGPRGMLSLGINNSSPVEKGTSPTPQTAEIYFLPGLEAGSPRSSCQQAWFLLRPLSACGRPSSHCVLTWSRLCVHTHESGVFVCVPLLIMTPVG